MKSLHRILALTGVAASLMLTSGSLHAQAQNPQGGRGQPGQGRGNFDPEQMRQRMMDGYREALEVKDDDEWKLISERITKVTEAARSLRTAGGGFPGRTRGGAPPGGATDNNGGGGGRTRTGGGGPPGFTREPDPELEALQKAIEAKASPDEIKAKLARLRDAHKDKEAKLEKLQDDLRQVLSARQEAIAVTMGLLK